MVLMIISGHILSASDQILSHQQQKPALADKPVLRGLAPDPAGLRIAPRLWLPVAGCCNDVQHVYATAAIDIMGLREVRVVEVTGHQHDVDDVNAVLVRGPGRSLACTV